MFDGSNSAVSEMLAKSTEAAVWKGSAREMRTNSAILAGEDPVPVHGMRSCVSVGDSPMPKSCGTAR